MCLYKAMKMCIVLHKIQGNIAQYMHTIMISSERKVNVNVNVHVYSPDIPVGSADCTIYTPGIGTHSFTVSSPLGRIQHLRTLLQL